MVLLVKQVHMLTWANSLMAESIIKSNILNGKTKSKTSKIRFY